MHKRKKKSSLPYRIIKNIKTKGGKQRDYSTLRCVLKKVKTILATFLVSVGVLFGSGQTTEAADAYSVIYSDVASYNGDAVECDWITNAILYASGAYQVDPFLITAVMQTESGFNLNAYSPAGAVGLMQLMPGTASGLGVDPYDPFGNVLGGTMYLRIQLDNFAGWGAYAVTDAVAAYNAGPNAVYQYNGVPPYSETQNYVIQVNNAYQNLLNMSCY